MNFFLSNYDVAGMTDDQLRAAAREWYLARAKEQQLLKPLRELLQSADDWAGWALLRARQPRA